MAFGNMRVSTRLVIAFGILLMLMATLIGIGVTAQERSVESTRYLMFGIGLVVLLLGVVFAYGLVSSIVSPLEEAIQIAGIGAPGDLSHDFVTTRGGEFGRLLPALGTMEDILTDLVTRIKASTDPITVASGKIARGNANLSQRTDEQALSLKRTAASMQELTSTVRQNAERAQSASELAVNASSIAGRGGAAVGEVVSTMDAISASSKKIVDIIGVIEGIAFQTNILALNAAVEAARAGEQSRGFAVAASEGGSLAQRSAQAAKESKALIEASVGNVSEGGKLVGKAGRN